MKLTVLGAGQFYVTPGDVSLYNATGNLVQVGDTNVILDFGRGCLRTLLQAGVSVHDIDAICITHLHPDHVADVLPFFQAHFIERKLFHTPGKELTIFGPTGIQAWVDQQIAALYDELPYQPTVIEQPSHAQIGGVVIDSQSMQHPIPDIAYRVTAGDQSITYSGDTGNNANLVPFAKDTDILILECANDIPLISPNHLNPIECAEIAQAAHAKHLVFTHYGRLDRQIHLIQAAKGRFDGMVTCGEELLNISL